MLESLDRHDGPALVVDGRPWGICQPFVDLGVPAMSYGTIPPYLLSAPEGGHLDKVSRHHMRAEIEVLARLIRRLDALETSALLACS